MKRLLDAFAAAPSRETANKLLRYIDAHPFAAAVFVDAGSALIIGIARDMVRS